MLLTLSVLFCNVFYICRHAVGAKCAPLCCASLSEGKHESLRSLRLLVPVFSLPFPLSVELTLRVAYRVSSRRVLLRRYTPSSATHLNIACLIAALNALRAVNYRGNLFAILLELFIKSIPPLFLTA